MSKTVLAPPQEKLGELLVEAGALVAEQLEAAIVESRRLGKWLGEYLVAEGLVTPADLAMTLSLQLNVPFIDLKRHAVQPQALQLVSEEYARQRNLIPIDVVGDALVVVMADPGNVQVLEDLKAPAKLAMEVLSRAGLAPFGAYHWLSYAEPLYFDGTKAERELEYRPKWSNVDMMTESYDWYLAHRDELHTELVRSPHRSPVREGLLRILRWIS